MFDWIKSIEAWYDEFSKTTAGPKGDASSGKYCNVKGVGRIKAYGQFRKCFKGDGRSACSFETGWSEFDDSLVDVMQNVRICAMPSSTIDCVPVMESGHPTIGRAGGDGTSCIGKKGCKKVRGGRHTLGLRDVVLIAKLSEMEESGTVIAAHILI